MSVAGVAFTDSMVALGVWMEVAWRGRANASATRLRRQEVVRVVMAAVITAGISISAALTLLSQPADGSTPWVGYLALVALATVVGTVGAGSDPWRARAVGLGLGAPPALVGAAVVFAAEPDAFWLVAVVIAVVAGGAVSAAVWVLTVIARWGFPTLRWLTGAARRPPGRAR